MKMAQQLMVCKQQCVCACVRVRFCANVLMLPLSPHLCFRMADPQELHGLVLMM